MKIKIAHLADLHVGSHQYGLKDRKHSVLMSINKLSSEISEGGYNVVLVSGDIFDYPYPEADEIWVMQKFCKTLTDKGIEVFCCVGNHDKQDNSTLQLSDVIGAGKISSGMAETKHDIRIAVRNHHNRRGLPDMIKSLDEDLDIIMMHQSVGGFLPSIMSPELDKEVFDQVCSKCRYLALGDLHVHKFMKVGGCIAAYPGIVDFIKTSNAWNDFKFWSIDYDTTKKKVSKMESVPFIPWSQTLVTSTEDDDYRETLREWLAQPRGDVPFVILKHTPEKQEEADAVAEELTARPEILTHLIPIKSQVQREERSIQDDTEDGDDFIQIVRKDKTVDEREIEVISELWHDPTGDRVASILNQDLQSELQTNE